jgi:DnaJ-domain-containing protein 1
MSRPLFRNTFDELERLFLESPRDLTVLHVLLNELRCRTVTKAAGLRRKVVQNLVASKEADSLRPLLVAELRDVFIKCDDDLDTLTKLSIELQRRTSSTATSLRTDVDAALARVARQNQPQPTTDTPPTHHILECVACGKRLRIPFREGKFICSCSACKAEFTADYDGGVLRVVFGRNDAPLTVEEAHVLFGVDATASWEQIEKERRKLLQQYHPDKVATAGVKIRELAEKEVKRINLAYDLLRRHRESYKPLKDPV